MLRKKAFTLIELLIVIAIISLLVSILLPTLSQARREGQRTVCFSNMHGLALGALIYAEEEDGYLPLLTNGFGTDGWIGRLLPYVGVVDISPVQPFYHLPLSSDAYRRLSGTVFDCPTVPGPSLDPNQASVENWYRYNYAMNSAPHLILTREEVGEPACWSTFESYALRTEDIRNPGQTVIFGERNAGEDPPVAIGHSDSYGFRMYRWCIYYGTPVDWIRHGKSCNWAFYDGRAAPMTESEFWETGELTGHGWEE